MASRRSNEPIRPNAASPLGPRPSPAGFIVRTLRARKSITQEDLANLLEMNERTVRRIEAGHNLMPELARDIARLLDGSYAELMEAQRACDDWDSRKALLDAGTGHPKHRGRRRTDPGALAGPK
jgi:DNA-binding XRE family transcriptional regulator